MYDGFDLLSWIEQLRVGEDREIGMGFTLGFEFSLNLHIGINSLYQIHGKWGLYKLYNREFQRKFFFSSSMKVSPSKCEVGKRQIYYSN